MIAFTFGNARGSEGISVPAADWRAAKSLLRSNMESRVLMLIVLYTKRRKLTKRFAQTAYPGPPANYRLSRGYHVPRDHWRFSPCSRPARQAATSDCGDPTFSQAARF
jgi:hypothetical protein